MATKQTKKATPENTVPMVTGEITVNEVQQEDIFLIVNREGEYMIAIANKIVSREKFKSAEEARKYINSKPWELIFNATAIMWENLQEYKQSLNK